MRKRPAHAERSRDVAQLQRHAARFVARRERDLRAPDDDAAMDLQEVGRVEPRQQVAHAHPDQPFVLLRVDRDVLVGGLEVQHLADRHDAHAVANADVDRVESHSRQQEGSADAAAVRHLNEAHYSGKGMISFFGKLRQEEYRLSPSYTSVDPYMMSHPMTAERQSVLLGDLQKSPWWNAPEDAAKRDEFLRIKAKLIGFMDDPPLVLRKYPESDQSVPAMYARAYAWHRGGYPDRAVQEVDKLVARTPRDPYFLELKGQILLESGKPAEAIPALRQAVIYSQNAPLISALLGHALVASEDPANLREAAQVLKVAVQRDTDNPQAWYNLGLIYTKLGDEPRARLASAERYSLDGNPRMAMISAEQALRGIPQGTPDYLRAQDIAMTARDEAQRTQRRR